MDKKSVENTSCIVYESESIRDVMKAIDVSTRGIAVVVDIERRLLGTITDGDIRRAIIRGASIDEAAYKIMNRDCVFVHEGYSDVFVDTIFKVKKIMQIPVVDENMKVLEVLFLNDFYSEKEEKSNYAIIMAGGLGTRLRPLTEEIPKPMLKVGDRPIMETIITQLRDFGYKKILVSVNYKSHMIENYFQDGRNFGVDIEYIHEPQKMGTAGAIKLVERYLDEDFIVVNGDILTKLNFEHFIKYHKENKNQITIASRKYDMQIPYGVLNINGDKVEGLAEKPVVEKFVSAGIYCLSPDVIDCIPENEYYDITTLIENVIVKSGSVGSFPITEYWMDIGYIEDYNKANKDYFEIFRGGK